MSSFLKEIQILLNQQTAIICKRLDRLETKYNTLRGRVSRLEKSAKQKRKKYILNKFDFCQFTDLGEGFCLQDHKELWKMFPPDYENLICYIFSSPANHNIAIKGERIYTYRQNGWVLENSPNFLTKCNSILWSLFDLACFEQQWNYEKRTKIPFSNAQLKTIFLKIITKGSYNRHTFK